jgi:hypothetical protein
MCKPVPCFKKRAKGPTCYGWLMVLGFTRKEHMIRKKKGTKKRAHNRLYIHTTPSSVSLAPPPQNMTSKYLQFELIQPFTSYHLSSP